MNRRAFFRGVATGIGAAAACAVAVRAPACNLVVDFEKPLRDARTATAIRVAQGDIKAYEAYFKLARESNEHFIRTMEMMRDAYCDLETAPAIEYVRPAFDAAVSAI